jgi:transposase
LDVHKKTIVVCVITGGGRGKREIRTFSSMTEDLRKLVDWLQSEGITHVAMESTGSYWKPVFNLLEESEIGAIVVNAAHIKAVPGRKTDVRDAEWIAELMRHGLLRGSFIPDREHRELRELVRYRRSVVQERSREIARLQKVLEGANIKLDSVVSSVMGKSSRRMLERIVQGHDDPEELASLALGRLRTKKDELVKALDGLIGPHQRFLLEEQLRHIEELEDRISRLTQEIESRMRPFEAAVNAIDDIPGIGRIGAQEIIAEIGVDMSRFPSHGHLASWAKVCPGNNESAGKRRSGRSGRGNPWLRSTLVEAAWAAARTKDSYLRAQYYRLKSRRGAKRAALAVGHSILVAVYYMLRDGTAYQDLGADFFNQLSADRIAKYHTHRLKDLGFDVTLTKAA